MSNMPNKEDFFAANDYVLYGVSPDRKTFAASIQEAFKAVGKKTWPVDERGIGELYKAEDTPGQISSAIVVLGRKNSPLIIDDLASHGIKIIWLQYGSYDNSIKKQYLERGFQLYTGCALMYLPGTGFAHRLHRRIHEFFVREK